MPNARDWRWSSTRALLDPGRGDGITDSAPVLERTGDFAALIEAGEDMDVSKALRRAESAGRPLGGHAFLEHVATLAGRDPTPRKGGLRPRAI